MTIPQGTSPISLATLSPSLLLTPSRTPFTHWGTPTLSSGSWAFLLALPSQPFLQPAHSATLDSFHYLLEHSSWDSPRDLSPLVSTHKTTFCNQLPQPW